MNQALAAALLFSKQLVENRKRDNHNKPSVTSKNDEVLAKLVGQKMQLSNIEKIATKIKNYDKESK